MLKQVKISVLMAVFNTDFSYIKRAIDSVLIQDFQDFELIIIDDGSTVTNR
jgi:glycosyltransferase involved in cell wall biosynthesis